MCLTVAAATFPNAGGDKKTNLLATLVGYTFTGLTDGLAAKTSTSYRAAALCLVVATAT